MDRVAGAFKRGFWIYAARKDTLLRKSLFILGNCNALTYKLAFKALLPDWDVSEFALVEQNRDQRADVGEKVGNAEIVLFQDELTNLPELANLEECLVGRTVVRVPFLTTYRYHPDLNQAWLNGRMVPNGRFSMHSSTVFLGYKRGRSVDEVLKVLSDPSVQVFGEIGMNDAFEQRCIASFSNVGINLKKLMPLWSRFEAFTHVPHHPVSQALTDIAQEIALINGWIKSTQRIQPDFLDPLRGTQLPVYASVARTFGISPRPFARDSQMREYTLKEWIEVGYETYQEWDRLGWTDDVQFARDVEPLLDSVV